jgi:hypothetical protein
MPTRQELIWINKQRLQEGLPPLNTKGEVKKPLGRPKIDPELLKRPQRKSTYLNFIDDPPKQQMKRPPAVYNNTSYLNVFEKYGV